MELRPRKQFRTENTSNIGPSPNSCKAKSASVKEDNQTIPGLVSHIFLANLRDVGLLKTCRLVCKSWNIDATVSLRAWSKVYICDWYEKSKFIKFRTLLRRRAIGTLYQLPSPFRNIHAEGTIITNPAFISLVLLPEYAITGLDLALCDLNRKIDQTKFGRLLAANKLTITNLDIFGGCIVDSNESLLAYDEIKLTALKRLIIKDRCQQCRCVPIMKNILGMTEPENMEFIISDGEILLSLLSQDKVDNMKNLKLNLRSVSTKAWRHLGKLRFSKLRTFAFRTIYPIVDEPQQVEQWNLLCQNISQFVETFDLDTSMLSLRTDYELSFPNLRIIQLWDQNILYKLKPERFPSLTKVVCRFSRHLTENPYNDEGSHPGVRSVEVCFQHGLRNQETLQLLAYLSRQFPKVSSVGIDVPRFCESAITTIYEAFPKITALRLNGSCDYYCFSGTPHPDPNMPFEMTHGHKSIMDFLELEKISLGPYFILEPNMMSLCLPRIPKLKHLEFYWGKSLSASLLRDSVGHLETIIISNSTKDEYRADMAQVSKMVPSVVGR